MTTLFCLRSDIVIFGRTNRFSYLLVRKHDYSGGMVYIIATHSVPLSVVFCMASVRTETNGVR